MATIKIKRGTTDPSASNVTNAGELAANTSTPKVFLKTADDSVTAPVWVGATIEASPGDWTSATKLATQSAINTTFMPKGGGTFTGAVSFGQGSTAAGEIRLLEDTDDGSNYSAFRGSARAANITYVMPTTDPTAGQILSAGAPSSNVSQLSWASPSSATTVTTNSDNTNTTRYLVFSSSAQSGATLYVDDTTTPLSYNPSTNNLSFMTTGSINVNAINSVGEDTSVAITSTGSDTSASLSLTGSAAAASSATTTATTINLNGAIATNGSSFELPATYTFADTGTASNTLNIQTGAVGNGNTKTINIGTGGVAGSTTNINLGQTNGGTVTVNKDLTVTGNLTVSGTTTTVNSTTVTVVDPLLFLASNNNAADIVDIGFYGLYDTSGTQDLYTGLFRDASDDKYRLFKGLQTAPTTSVNTAGTGYTVATLVADIEGKVNGLTVTSSTGTLTVANGKTLTASNTLTFTGTDSSSVAFGAGGTVAYLGSNNAFTGANTFTNASGQAFRQSAAEDGVIVTGRAGGTSTYAVTVTPTTLGASRTFTLPDVDGTAITTGNLTAITATGTIASGTWNGTAIGAAYGGTGQTTYTVGDIVYASGATAISKLSSSATAGAVLASTGSAAAPEYKTISVTNGSVTPGSGTLTLAIQDASADGTTKGLAAFNSSDFNSASGVITIDTVDGGTY